MSEWLGRDGLAIATVDLATPLLARAGVFRTSVQLMVATPWDGGGDARPVNCDSWRRR